MCGTVSYMLLVRKLTATVTLVGLLAACSQASTTPPTVETTTSYSSQAFETPTASTISTIPAEATEKSAEALAYEQNIGDDLANEACVTMLNIQTWLEEDRAKAFAHLNKVINVAKTYEKSAALYILDTKALKDFQDAMSDIAITGEEVVVALTAFNLEGLLYIKDLIQGMQSADANARRHFKTPLSPPCV